MLRMAPDMALAAPPLGVAVETDTLDAFELGIVPRGLAANHIKRFGHTRSVRLQARFSSVGRELGVERVTARFHSYSELKHTWMCGDEGIQFKISDYLEGAPDDVFESLAWYMLSKASRKGCAPGRSQRYLAYSRSRELWESVRGLYFQRSRNVDLDPLGDARDLRPAFAYVNSFYFAGRLPQLQLAWARESPRRRLGYYFEPLGLLAVNSALDSAEVPRYVLEFVIFHELLHHADSMNGRPRRRVHHTKGFREQERGFSHYHDSEVWLRRIVAGSQKKR